MIYNAIDLQLSGQSCRIKYKTRTACDITEADEHEVVAALPDFHAVLEAGGAVLHLFIVPRNVAEVLLSGQTVVLGSCNMGTWEMY